MKKKIAIEIFLVILVFLSLFTTNVYATYYSKKVFDIETPREYNIIYDTTTETNVWILETDQYYTTIRYGVYERTETKTKYTQEDLNEFVDERKNNILLQDGDSIKNIHKELIENNGCWGMRWAYKHYFASMNHHVAYQDIYYFLTDNYEITLNFETSNPDFIDSEEQKQIMKSFKIKDTVLQSRGIPFTDIPSNSWYEGAVKYVYENNIIKGYNEYTYKPEDKLTRAMLVTILYRMEGSPEVSGTSKFPDVQDISDYYYSAVKWATQNGVVSGYDNGRFGPLDYITREQLAVMLNNYCRYKGKYKTTATDLLQYKDGEKVSEFAKWGMNWAVGSGVITGTTYGYLNPQGTATRAETASMIYKYCLNIK